MGMKLNKVCQWEVQCGSNMTGTNCDLFTHKSSRSYLNHLVLNKIILKTVFQFLDPRFIEQRIIRIMRIMFFLVVSELYV
jgi:hypothetical protein